MPIEKRWVVKPQGDSEAVAKLASVLRISPVLANLLVQRGIDTVEKADKFFKPSLADLHDPFLMKDMDKAVERVEQAGNRITITTGGLVHDMFCDGTLENGVDDVAGIGGRHIRVAATWEDGVHKLRPFNKKVVAVTRKLDGDEMLWRYGPFRNRLRRLTEPPLDHPATRAAHEAAQENT